MVLHNLACCYQRSGLLEDCVSYLDGTIYNIDSKITTFDEEITEMTLLNEGEESEPLTEEVTSKLTIASKF